MRHFAYTPKKTRTGVVAENVRETKTRGDAEKQALTLQGHYGGGEVVSFDGDLAEGTVVPPDAWGRRP